MSGEIDIPKDDYLHLNLGGKPEITYTLYWRNNAFLFDHQNTIDIHTAIKRVEAAMIELKKEYGITSS